jgi:putative NADH-flavin reductase
MTKIAIVGATGPTGIHLVAELRRNTAVVRAIARDMDKLARLFPDTAVEKRAADILDADATLRAVEGCDLVYDCIGLPGDRMHLHPVTSGTPRHDVCKCRAIGPIIRRCGRK